jgi:hypothetical protein
MSDTTTWLERTIAEADVEGFEILAHHDLSGHGDGFQVIRRDRYVYVAHLGVSPMALSILDVSDATRPRLLRQLEHPENTRCHKVQLAGNVLIQNNELPYWAKDAVPAPRTGLSVYDVSDPTDPRPIGFHPGAGVGTHRLWLSELPYAHISNTLPGGRTQSYEIVDLTDPAHPASAGLVGARHLPG